MSRSKLRPHRGASVAIWTPSALQACAVAVLIGLAVGCGALSPRDDPSATGLLAERYTVRVDATVPWLLPPNPAAAPGVLPTEDMDAAVAAMRERGFAMIGYSAIDLPIEVERGVDHAAFNAERDRIEASDPTGSSAEILLQQVEVRRLRAERARDLDRVFGRPEAIAERVNAEVVYTQHDYVFGFERPGPTFESSLETAAPTKPTEELERAVQAATHWAWADVASPGAGFDYAATFWRRVDPQRVPLGVATADVPSPIARAAGLNAGEGRLVTAVWGNSPAAKAGLQAGDVVRLVNGARVGGQAAWQALLERQAGAQLALTVWRLGAGSDVQLVATVNPGGPPSRRP